MNVKRVTLAGSAQAVAFDNQATQWLVKNFSSSDVYVAFDSDAETDESIKIPSECAQLVVDNTWQASGLSEAHDTIYLTGTGEVEVQQVCYNP